MYFDFKKSCEKSPNAKALYFLGKNIKYKNVLKMVDSLSVGLKEMGVKKDDVVTICLPNMPNAVVAFYAVNKIGAIANMVHPLTPTNQIVGFMECSNSKIVFMLDTAFKQSEKVFEEKGYTSIICGVQDYLPKIKSIIFKQIVKKDIKDIKYSEKVLKFKDLYKVGEVTAETDNEKPSVYLHSGGTTGEPKTLVLSDNAFINLARRGPDILEVKDILGKSMLAVLPMFHGFGLCMCIHTILSFSGTSILFPKFMPKDVCKLIKKGKVNYIAGVPTMYEIMYNTKGIRSKGLKNVSFAFCGGDSVPKSLKEKYDKLFAEFKSDAKMFEGYGLTETVTVCAVNNKANDKFGSCGKPLKDIEMKAINSETTEFLGVEEEGELVVKGDTLMLGYLNDDEANNRVFITDKQGNKWVRTGDFGYVDADGFVWFKQRLKRIIKVSGVAVFPSEIENATLRVENVSYACAVKVKDKTKGHVVKLYVSLIDKNVDNDEMKEKILTHLKKNVIRWAVPKQIEILDKLPLTMVGKVDYKVLEAENEV